MLTILSLYGAWVIAGYIAFRINYWYSDGKTMFEHEVGENYVGPIYDYKFLTPKMGLCYMLFGGAGILVVVFVRMTYLAISSREFNRSITVNKFFGIK